MRVGRAVLLGLAATAAVAIPVAAVLSRPRDPSRSAPSKAAATAEVWTCSMHPQVRLPRPGRCPICGMDLIPAARTAPARPEATPADVGIETEPVIGRALSKEIRTVGKLDFNERRVADITARIAGRIDRLYADFTGIHVKKGDHLAEIYSPALYAAQAELFLALNAYEKARSNARTLGGDLALSNVEAGRTKLRLWGITPEQLAEIERSRQTRVHLTIFAPIGGTVIEKAVREGQYVKEGDLLYRIADLDPLWLYLDIYEYDLAWIRYGQPVDVALEAYPGEAFRGTVTFIEPFLDDKTRTVKVRVNLKNPDGRLKPAMYASATIRVRLRGDGSPEATGVEGKYWCPMHPEVVQDRPGPCPICQMPLERVPEIRPPASTAGGGHEAHGGAGHEHAGHGDAAPSPEPGRVLAIPSSAVLDTGRRKLVYRRAKGGGFEPVEVRVGPLAEARVEGGRTAGFYPVLEGLNEGDRVVVQGGFLLDSQRQIEGRPSLLYPEGQSGVNLHAGHGGGAAGPATAPTGGGHRH